MAICFNQFSSRRSLQTKIAVKKLCVRHEIELFNVLNDEFAAGLIGLVPAYLLWSHSPQCAHARSDVAVLSVGAIFEN